MNKRMIIRVLVVLLIIAGNCGAGCSAKGLQACPPKKSDANSLESALGTLDRKTSELRSYQGRIEYLFRQPLLESSTLRKGLLYYERTGKQSQLRINLETLQQDDEAEQKYIEHVLFDGMWLTRVDYQIKQVTMQQLADPNESADAFDLVSQNIPIIGFGKTEALKKQFEIKLVKKEPGKADDPVHLHLKAKPDSIYKDDYASIDFWIDQKLGLPRKIVAVTPDDDIYQIKLLKPKINEKIDKKVFDFKIPKGFTVEKKPLKKKEAGPKSTGK